MRKNKIVVLLLLVAIMVLSAALVACVPIEEPHVCGHVCPTCKKCTDSACTNSVCADKCQGHEEPKHEKCPNCEGCLDLSCTTCEYACECIINEERALASAVQTIKGLYKEKTVLTASADFTAVTSVIGVEEDRTTSKNFPVSIVWTLENVKGLEDVVSIALDSETNNYVLSVKYDEENTIATTFTLKAVITCGDKTEIWTLDSSVPKFEPLTFAQYLEKAKDATVVVRGVVVAVISKTNGNSVNGLYLTADDGGYYVYNMAKDPVTEGIKLGDTLLVVGKKDDYNGTLEVVDATITVESSGADITPRDITELYKAAAKANNLKDEDLVYPQSQLVTIKGVEITDQDETNGYYRFKLDGLESYVRISSSVCPLSKADIATFKAGHTEHTGWTANVTGVVCVYSGAFYLTPVSVDAFEYTSLPERDSAGQVAYEKENLTLTSSVLFDQEIELPAKGTAYDEVAITWDFKADTTHTTATIADGKLKVTLGDAAETITLVATIKHGAEIETREFTINVSSSIKDWKTAAWAIAEAKKLAAGATSEGWYYIYGEIVSDPTADYCNFNLTDGTDTLIVYGLYNKEGTGRYGSARELKDLPLPVKKGDKVFLYAQIQHYVTKDGNTTKYELVNARLQTPSDRDLYSVSVVKTPVAGTEYKLAMWQNNLGKVYYATGEISSRYLSTTTDASKAAKVTVVAAEGGYYIKIGDKYLTITGEEYNSKLSTSSPKLTDTATTVFIIDANGVLVFTASATGYDDGTFFLGTFETNISIGASATSFISDTTKIDVSQFVARLVAVEASSEGGEGEGEGEGSGSGSAGTDTPAVPVGSVESPKTVAEAITACNALASGAYSDVIWYVKGYIVGTPSFNSSYSNYTLNIATELGGTATIKVYGLKLNSKATAIYEGDLIVISGYLQNYNGNTPEITFNNASTGTQKNCLLEAYTVGTGTIAVGTDSSANATVAITDNKTSGTNGKTFTFTVTVATGHELVNVKVNDEIVTANENVYTGTVAGTTTIVVTTKEEGVTETTNYSHQFASGGLKTGSNTWSDVAWNVTMEGSTYIGWDANNGKGIQLGKGESPATSVIISTEGISNFKIIKLNLSKASNGAGKVIVKVGDVQVGNEINLTTTATDYTFTLDAESSAKIEIIFTNTAKAMYIGSIEVTA